MKVEHQEFRACRDHRAYQERIQDLLALQETPEHRVQLENRAFVAKKAPMEHRALLDSPATLVQPAHLGKRESLGYLVETALTVARVQRAHLVNQVMQVHLVHVALEEMTDCQVRWVSQELLVSRERPGLSVHRAFKDHPEDRV